MAYSVQYGVLDSDCVHHDAGRTLRGAMIIATRGGYTGVSCRFNGGYNVTILANKTNGKTWKMTSYGADLKQRGLI